MPTTDSTPGFWSTFWNSLTTNATSWDFWKSVFGGPPGNVLNSEQPAVYNGQVFPYNKALSLASTDALNSVVGRIWNTIAQTAKALIPKWLLIALIIVGVLFVLSIFFNFSKTLKLFKL
jgi:hypothetical protein